MNSPFKSYTRNDLELWCQRKQTRYIKLYLWIHYFDCPLYCKYFISNYTSTNSH